MNTTTTSSTLPSQQFIPAQFPQIILNQQNQLPQQHSLQSFQASVPSTQKGYQHVDPQSPVLNTLRNENLHQGNGSILKGNSGSEIMKTMSSFGTPHYQNQYQVKGNISQQTEAIKNKSQNEIISGNASSISTIPQFSINGDSQIAPNAQINNNYSSQPQENRSQISSQFLYNTSLPTAGNIDFQQNLVHHHLLNQSPLLANINMVNQNQALQFQGLGVPLNQMNMGQQQLLQNLQAQQQTLLSSAATQYGNTGNNIQPAFFQADKQNAYIENLFNQTAITEQLQQGNPNQQKLMQEINQQYKIQQQAHQQWLLFQSQVLMQQQQPTNLHGHTQQNLIQQVILQQQYQQSLNNFFNNQISLLNNQPCLVEESEGLDVEDVIPPIKKEHDSIHEDEQQSNEVVNSPLKVKPSVPQQIGQISATLFEKPINMLDQQSFLHQIPALSHLNKQISFPPIADNLIRRISVQETVESDMVDEDEDDSNADNDESEIQEMRHRQEQQQKLFKSLSKAYQMQLNTSKMQNGEFQSPATPQEQKHQKYITPLRAEYQNLIMDNTNRIKGTEKIKQIIAFADQQYIFQPLPFDYKSVFSDNLIYLVESIHKNSIIRQNPHLLYGSISKSGRPQSASFSSQATTRLFETPQMHPLAKIEEFNIAPNNSNPSFPNDNFSLNGGFSLRNSLKKIQNNSTDNNQLLQKNMISQEEEFSSDSFGQNMEVNLTRARQISNLSANSINGQSPTQVRSHKQSFTSNQMNTPTLNSTPVSNSHQTSERTLLNLYSSNMSKDRERSKQFATAKNTQGNRSRAVTESSMAPSPALVASPGGIQKRSKYHNLTKLFMYFLLSLFQHENMERLGVPEHIQQELIKSVQNVKKTAKKKIKNKNLQKTDFFNHTHYNALFLHLNKNSLRELQKKEKDIQVHKQCFGLDLSEVDIQRLEYVNILKKFAYEIVTNTLEAPSVSECENNPRNEYMLKALSGIRQLAQGNVIFRFQQVYGPQSSVDDDV